MDVSIFFFVCASQWFWKCLLRSQLNEVTVAQLESTLKYSSPVCNCECCEAPSGSVNGLVHNSRHMDLKNESLTCQTSRKQVTAQRCVYSDVSADSWMFQVFPTSWTSDPAWSYQLTASNSALHRSSIVEDLGQGLSPASLHWFFSILLPLLLSLVFFYGCGGSWNLQGSQSRICQIHHWTTRGSPSTMCSLHTIVWERSSTACIFEN